MTIRHMTLALCLMFGTSALAQQSPPAPLNATPPVTPVPAQSAAPAMALTPSAINDPYLIENIDVDVKDKSAAAARDKAIFDAQRAGLAQILERLGVPHSLDPSQVSDGKLAQIVQDFEIVKEKTSSVRYIATLNVRFKPMAIQNMLEGAGLGMAAMPSRPTVILPVSTSNNSAVLWEERTAWRTACENLAHNENSMLPIIVPPGELNDISAIDANDALAGTSFNISNIALNYNAGFVFVAQIAPDFSTLNPAEPLSITTSRYDATGVRISTDVLTVPPAATIEAQFASATQAIQNLLWQYKKNDAQGLYATAGGSAPPVPLNATMTSTQTSLPVSAPVMNLTELARLKQQLNAVTGLNRAEVTSLRRGDVDMRLDFNGDITQLQQALAQQNLTLAQNPSGAWRLQGH